MFFNKGKKEYPDDDGRVIADMNVAGMPWFDSKADARRRLFGGRRNAQAAQHQGQGHANQRAMPQYDKGIMRVFLRSSILASLLIVSVYILVFAAFILFLTSIW